MAARNEAMKFRTNEGNEHIDLLGTHEARQNPKSRHNGVLGGYQGELSLSLPLIHLHRGPLIVNHGVRA